MAQTNFRAQDFKKAKGAKAEVGKSEPRADNEFIDAQIDAAIEDPKAGVKVAKEIDKGIKEADEKIDEEISNTEKPLENQPGSPKATAKKAPAKKTASK